MGDVIRVVVVDDDAMVRTGLKLILGGAVGLELVGECSDGEDAPGLVAELAPDVVLMDIRMPRRDGLWATRQLLSRRPAPRILVLTTFDADDLVLQALAAGASGFLLKDTDPARMVEAIRAVAAGDPVLSPTVASRVIAAATSRAGDPRQDDARAELERLAERELDVALAIGRGLSNAEIAAELFMSVATVKAYVTRILTKLGLDNRVQVALKVHDAGLDR